MTTTANMTHSPLPWRRNIPPIAKYPIIYSGRNTHVCQVITQYLSVEEQEANAQLICTAVNSHQALVEALGTLLKMVEDGDWTTVELDEARAALSLATGGNK